MNNSKSLINPLWPSFFVGLTSLTGFIIGKALGSRKKSPNAVLKNVVKEFKREAPIEGSWINNRTVPYQKYAFKTMAYEGGISRKEDDQLVDYAFLADAYTGSIIDIQRNK